MATEDLDVIRAALDEATAVDASRIDLDLDLDDDDDGSVVLRGAVATAEEASAAGLVVEEYADVVRNLLWVDPNLREAAGSADAEQPAVGDSASPDDPQRATEMATGEMGGEIVTDVQESLDENVAWEPPDEPVMVPSAGEERGALDHPAADVAPADAGPLSEEEADAATPSLPELSPEELARSARPVHHDQEEHH